jgi:hypothetical protein
MDIKIAETLSVLIMKLNASLDDSVAYVRDHCSEDELHWYRREVGKIMGGLNLEIEEKLWSEHPALRPREMGRNYEVDAAIFEPRFYAVRREPTEMSNQRFERTRGCLR